MKIIANLVFVVTAASFVCGCGNDAPEKASPKSDPEGAKPRTKLIAEPEVLPKANPTKQLAEEAAETVAEPEAVVPAESAGPSQQKAQRRKMTDEERKARREKRREEFYRKVEAERNKTHEQRVKEHEEAMQRAQEKRDLQDARLKRILEKRAKQQAAEQGK